MRDEMNAGGGRPSLAWVPVVDARGRTHMEARWSAPAAATAAAAAAPTSTSTSTSGALADHHAA